MSIPSQGPKPLLALHTSSSTEDGNGSIVLRTAAPSITIHPKSPVLEDQNKSFKKSVAVKYMECLKNHAAAIGGNATDGCGEFMAGGEEGSLEALKCSACNCHRNFHRKINIQPEPSSNSQCHPSAFGPAVMKKSIYGAGTELGGEVKKRFRTKFTQEQKEKMLSFAEKAGWKIQKLDDSEVRRFCQEIGIKRKVLKVWMHNNKYHLAKKNNTTS
ncbi:hypothetical protein Pfo_007616 [Paulownia fortunei]|nr:hypothetical protein Pfo_007616 [Paulownia fortunei]